MYVCMYVDKKHLQQTALLGIFRTTLQIPEMLTHGMQMSKMLALTVESVVVPKYGFEGTLTGVSQMMESFDALRGNAEMYRQAFYLHQLLVLIECTPQRHDP